MVSEWAIQFFVVGQTLLLSHLPLALGDEEINQAENDEDASEDADRNASLRRGA